MVVNMNEGKNPFVPVLGQAIPTLDRTAVVQTGSLGVRVLSNFRALRETTPGIGGGVKYL